MDTLFQIDSFEVFQNVTQEVITGLYYTGKTQNTLLDAEVFEKVKHEMKTIISDCEFDLKNVVIMINKKEWSQEKVNYFLNVVENNWSELLSAALNHYNSSYGETIINFDWLVKYILGTSELKTLKQPLLQLILSTVNKIGHPHKVMYDINKDMLLKVIHVLENI